MINFKVAILCMQKSKCYVIFTRYKIHVRVSDESGDTTFVIFNQDAEKLLDSSANKFVNRLGIGNNQFPEEITTFIGKSFVFKIKLTNYNLKDGLENYTVVKMFEVDDTLEAKYCGLSTKKVFVYFPYFFGSLGYLQSHLVSLSMFVHSDCLYLMCVL